MGRAIPGHVVEIIDDNGNVLPPETYGQIAIRKPNPSIFIGYWNDPEATQARFIGDWLCTGDYATKDADGYFWFTGREDDIIESGGYRIGPGEIEAALKRHGSVADAAVIGIADDIKGQVVKAFVTVKSGVVADKHLQDELRDHVRNKLEAHAYPKEIEFLDELPVGNTGKVMKQELRRMEREKAAANSKGEIS
ncbi:MAG: AMP-binding protein [Gammaproteobacteria bacterium]|nr:AMP-binding protein [Gammaproteobacteria bacterium]